MNYGLWKWMNGTRVTDGGRRTEDGAACVTGEPRAAVSAEWAHLSPPGRTPGSSAGSSRRARPVTDRRYMSTMRLGLVDDAACR